MNFNFLTGNTNPYPKMGPNPVDAAIARGTNPFGYDPNFNIDSGISAPSGMSMDKLGTGLSALGGILGGGQQEEQQLQPVSFAPVPMPQQVALPNLTPQLPSFDFADYLRKRQAGLL